ncbi:Crp/Fnr family transcriptional regulator [Dissulfurispira sp.]|uniref:Crp/Fnr family transcriptional regulator n=1 Tax=Dissulfurispira sp. TaxID=2817609 RepID=UPI002FDAF6C2
MYLGADGKEHILAVHKTGDFFGEMALLDGKTAPATVIAMEDTDILIMSRKDFEESLLKKQQGAQRDNFHTLYKAQGCMDDEQGSGPAACRGKGQDAA